MEKGKTSYRSKPVSSPSTYGETGYFNHFGGFHGTTDTYAYLGLFWILFQELFKGHFRSAKWIWKQNIWYRWHHRMCDTLDFHHTIYCLRDPWVRKQDAQDNWCKVWTGKDRWARYAEKDSEATLEFYKIMQDSKSEDPA